MWQTSLTWISVGQKRICISAHIHTHQPVKGGCSRSEPQLFGHVVKIFSLSLKREDGEAYVGERGGVHHKSEPAQSASPQRFFPALLPRALHDMRSVGLGRSRWALASAVSPHLLLLFPVSHQSSWRGPRGRRRAASPELVLSREGTYTTGCRVGKGRRRKKRTGGPSHGREQRLVRCDCD